MVNEKCAINYIENTHHRQICTICDPPKACKDNQENNIIVHCQKAHSGISNIQCIYCLEYVPLLSIIQHIDLHFTHVLKEPYICSVCTVSKSTAKALAQHSFKEHSINDFQLFSKCSHCNIHTGDPLKLKNHIEKSRLRIYHCAFPMCNVKSTNLSLMIEHAKSCHKINASCITQSVDYMCSWPKSQQPCDLSENDSMKAVPNGNCDQSICLSCPHCNHITQKMENFAQHVSSCKSNKVAGQLSVTCILYRCPICKKASTSKNMIKEHLTDFHASTIEESSICQEDFVVPLEEPYNQPVSGSNNFTQQSIADFSDLITSSMALSNFDGSATNSLFPNFAAMAAAVSAAANKQPNQDSPTRSNETPNFSNNQDEDKVLATGTKPIDPNKPLPTHLPTGQGVEEWVHLYFHENEFVTAFKRTKDSTSMADVTDSDLNNILDKLRTFSTYKVPILGRANQRRVAACPICYKPFNHGFTDLKKHLLIGHMDLRRDVTRFCINYTHSPRYNSVVTGLQNINDNQILKSSNLSNSVPPPNIVIDSTGNATDYSPSNNTVNSTVSHFAEQQFSEETKNYLNSTKSCNGIVRQEVESAKRNGAYSVPFSLANVGKNEVDMNTIEEAEQNRPTGRGGIIPLDDIGNPVEAAIQASQNDSEGTVGVIFRPAPGRQRIQLAYSLPVIRRLFDESQFSYADQLFLLNRLNRYSRMHVILEVGQHGMSTRRYSCAVCTYSSIHSLADVRKHVMGSHCGISQKRFRICLRASRHDSNSYRLLSDEKMLQFVDVQKRRQAFPNTNGIQNQNYNNDDSKSSNPGSVKTGLEEDDTDAEVSNLDLGDAPLTQTCPSTPAGTQPAVNPVSESTPTRGPKTTGLPLQATKDDLIQLQLEQDRLTGHMDNPKEGTDFKNYSGAPIVLRDNEVGVRIDLPFSETVLRQLMEREHYRGCHDVIVEKMNVYSRYHLIVASRSGRIHAYICVCGRRFAEKLVSQFQPDQNESVLSSEHPHICYQITSNHCSSFYKRMLCYVSRAEKREIIEE